MNSVTQLRGPIHLGMAVAKDAIAVGILARDEQTPVVERIVHDETSIRRLITKFPDRAGLKTCYEAGPTGYGLYRLLTSLGVACDVVAPALIPRRAGDRVKTDRRDAQRPARLHRAGELTAIRAPSAFEEAIRDLCRARGDLVEDRRRMRQRLKAFLLRHDRVYRDGQSWTGRHEQWLAAQHFDDAALRATYAHYRAALAARDGELAAIEADLMGWREREPFTDAVTRLAAYRGIGDLSALTLAAEVIDWRRFASAPLFMGFTGLVPSEYSSGEATRRGHITKAGNHAVRTALVEAAHAYRHRPLVGARLHQRQQRTDPATVARSWTAQQRLCGLPTHERPPQTDQRHRHRHRPGAGRLPVGRDDALTP
ncbi:IS110 family transposase [Planosporangium sp. 12N6]|uniref:IS110 family transposase n=1 Tax=Planosporangium spinosum TaxID=3402278 RepID=UPI003CEBDD8B